MTATASYQAGTEANAAQLSYGAEATWGVVPATTFQAIRATSETLAGTRDRTRPQEFNTAREMATAVTTRVQAGGNIAFALSYATYDDFLSCALGADWGATVAIAGVAADITLTNSSALVAVLSSTTSNKFSTVALGAWVRTLGFSNSANNDIWRVTARASNVSMTLTKVTTGAPVTETPTGTLAQVRACLIQNSTTFKSLYMQKKLSSSLWLNYPGWYPTAFTLSGGVGQFLNGSFTSIAQQELSATADASSGGITAAPSGRVHDPISGFTGVYWNEAKIVGTVDSFSLNVANTGAALEFGMGSSAAAGIMAGTLEVNGGTLKMYFNAFTLYAQAAAETAGRLSIITKDSLGNAYVITLLSAILINPKILAGGPGQAVYAEFTIEGGPQSGGGTIQIDRLPYN